MPVCRIDALHEEYAALIVLQPLSRFVSLLSWTEI